MARCVSPRASRSCLSCAAYVDGVLTGIRLPLPHTVTLACGNPGRPLAVSAACADAPRLCASIIGHGGHWTYPPAPSSRRSGWSERTRWPLDVPPGTPTSHAHTHVSQGPWPTAPIGWNHRLDRDRRHRESYQCTAAMVTRTP